MNSVVHAKTGLRTLLAWATLVFIASNAITRAAEPVHMNFETHAAFFSAETKQPKALDPHVFVRDETAAAAIGPQGIPHIAAFRPAFIQVDPASSPVFNAEGAPLGFSLGEWLAPTGTVTITPNAGGGVDIVRDFKGLRPNAQYSLFENHFDQKPIGFTPLDGKGIANAFKTDAEGNAHVTVTAPEPLTHANAVLVIYNRDGMAHGTSRGEIGVNAEHQLIARP